VGLGEAGDDFNGLTDGVYPSADGLDGGGVAAAGFVDAEGKVLADVEPGQPLRGRDEIDLRRRGVDDLAKLLTQFG
jgi:hypothetical protein